MNLISVNLYKPVEDLFCKAITKCSPLHVACLYHLFQTYVVRQEATKVEYTSQIHSIHLILDTLNGIYCGAMHVALLFHGFEVVGGLPIYALTILESVAAWQGYRAINRYRSTLFDGAPILNEAAKESQELRGRLTLTAAPCPHMGSVVLYQINILATIAFACVSTESSTRALCGVVVLSQSYCLYKLALLPWLTIISKVQFLGRV